MAWNREALVRVRADWVSGDCAFPWIGWHTLRHSFATALLSREVHLRTAQDLLRHKTAAMTMRVRPLNNRKAPSRGAKVLPRGMSAAEVVREATHE